MSCRGNLSQLTILCLFFMYSGEHVWLTSSLHIQCHSLLVFPINIQQTHRLACAESIDGHVPALATYAHIPNILIWPNTYTVIPQTSVGPESNNLLCRDPYSQLSPTGLLMFQTKRSDFVCSAMYCNFKEKLRLYLTYFNLFSSTFLNNNFESEMESTYE